MAGFNPAVVGAIFRKELRSFLANPTGYVFLTLFIGTSAAAAFLDESFFGRNLADLATLNKAIPAILMFFVPAITMNLWAEERRSGTEELLLTMPVHDVEVVLGKYLGALGVYTVGLFFSLANVIVLSYLGEPDLGLMFSTYLGYWLLGGLFVAVGMMGSMLTSNATVAFIIGALGCAALVFTGTEPWASGLVGVGMSAGIASLCWLGIVGRVRGISIAAIVGVVVGVLLWLLLPQLSFADIFARLSAPQHFASFGDGVVRLGDVIYFISGTGLVLYLCGFLLNRRHW